MTRRWSVNGRWSMRGRTAGIPGNSVSLQNARGGNGGQASIAEFGTLQLEWVTLSDRSNQSAYGDKAMAIYKRLAEKYPDRVRGGSGWSLLIQSVAVAPRKRTRPLVRGW